MPSFTHRIVFDESRYRTWESWMPNENGTTMPPWTAGAHRNGDCHKSEWPTPSPTPAEASSPFPGISFFGVGANNSAMFCLNSKGQRRRSVEERQDWICEHRKATAENGRSKCSKFVQPIQLRPRRDNATIRKVPIEFRGFHLPLAYGGDVEDCDRTAIDGFEEEIFNRANGGFRIRVKALGFETDDFNVFIDPDGVLGVDALHEQQTRDGMSVQRRITRRYQMASEVDVRTLCAFLAADGRHLEITGEKRQNQQQKLLPPADFKMMASQVPYSVTKSKESDRAEVQQKELNIFVRNSHFNV